MGKIFIENLKGPQGEDGESVYDIAVRHGFVGTEEDFLEKYGQAQIIDPITGLPSPELTAALAEAVLSGHVNDPTPHPTYDNIDLVTAYRLGKI